MPATDTETLANLINICLGCGILSLPWSFAGSSIVGGLAILAAGTLWNSATNIMIVIYADRVQKYDDLGDILSTMWGGPVLRLINNISLLVCTLLGNIGYLVVFADTFDKVVLEAILGLDASDSMWARPLMIVLGCAIVLPLCFLDQARLAYVSTISIFSNWYIAFVLIYQAMFADKLSTVCVVGWGVGDWTMLSVVMMAIAVQQCILPIFAEMENRNVERFVALQLKAVAVVIPLLSLVSLSGYMLYGFETPSNILVALPPTITSLFAQASIIPVVIGMYPLLLYPVTIMMKNASATCVRRASWEMKEPFLQHEGGRMRESVITLATVIFTGLCASTGIDLGPISNLVGIISLGWFLVTVPAILYRHALLLDGRNTALPWLHFAVGICCFVMTVLWTGNHLESIEKQCTAWWPTSTPLSTP